MMNGVVNGRSIRTSTLSVRAWTGIGRTLSLLLAVACLVGAAGCIERTVTINTTPEDATIILNDQEIGRSPVKVAFTWYGDYDVIIRKDGYQTVHTHARLNTPWYQLPGIDLVTECLIPFTVHDDRELAFPLEERVPTDNDAIFDRAEEVRRQALNSVE